MARNAMTDAALRAKWNGKDRRLNDGGTRGGGRLVADLRKGGARFVFAYFDETRTRRYLPIGSYDSAGKRGLTLAQARDEAARWSALYRSGEQNLHAYVERQREDAERTRRQEEEARQREEERARGASVKMLLDGYVAFLETKKRESAAKVRAMFAKDVLSDERLAARHAADPDLEDEFVDVIHKLVEAGKGRQAAKLRAFLHAAYQTAIRSRRDAAFPSGLRQFNLKANPIASIAALSEFKGERDRALSPSELAALLRRLEALEGAERDATLLALYLGGQRPTQLLRAGPNDVSLESGIVTLTDSKGRRRKPRRHVLPFGERAAEILTRRLEALPEGAERVFGNLAPTMVTRFVADLSAQMLEAKEIAEPFQLRDLRRTAESQLAAMGVSRDLRAQLLSHGLGGVQAVYDRHSYLEEKRDVLERWERHLAGLVSGESAKVTPIRSRKGAR